jgi:hypothetical protein
MLFTSAELINLLRFLGDVLVSVRLFKQPNMILARRCGTKQVPTGARLRLVARWASLSAHQVKSLRALVFHSQFDPLILREK